MMRRYREHWEEGRKIKITPPTPPPKGKTGPILSMLGFPIGCIKFIFPKLFITIFGLG
jgi:hypothetical protein